MKLLAKEQQESCENAKFCYICREKFEDKSAKNKKKNTANLGSIVAV